MTSSIRKRSGSGSAKKTPFKEKIIQVKVLNVIDGLMTDAQHRNVHLAEGKYLQIAAFFATYFIVKDSNETLVCLEGIFINDVTQ